MSASNQTECRSYVCIRLAPCLCHSMVLLSYVTPLVSLSPLFPMDYPGQRSMFEAFQVVEARGDRTLNLFEQFIRAPRFPDQARTLPELSMARIAVRYVALLLGFEYPIWSV
jgi:hypothetical protein